MSGGRRIAVVGGGAAGVATAYLLSARHRVTLYEAAPVPGGHIRTLGRNVPCDGLDPARPLEAGVIEFDRGGFHHFRALMAELGVPLRPVAISTSLYLPDAALHSPGVLRRSRRGAGWKAAALARSLPVGLRRLAFDRRVRRATPEALRGRCLGAWLPAGPLGLWMRALMTYAWSTPFPETARLPAEMAVPVLHRFMCRPLDWAVMPGGVYTWIARALERACARGASVRCDTPIDAIHRRPDGIVIESCHGTWHHDAVVIATSPGQIPKLLADPDGDEIRRFGAWRDHRIHTLVHDDRGMLAARGVTEPTAFDLFVDGRRGGYNALLDDLCGYDRDTGPRYGLALDIDDLIDPRRVLLRQDHIAPRYTVDAVRHRADAIAHNGHRRTWVAGAWLGDGLHEGAIASAVRVSRGLGGHCPTPTPA